MLDKRYQALYITSQTQSYTKTAQQLFITQPAVSQQISSLETELDLKLVDNIRGKIHLTDAGLKLAKYSHQVQLESDKVLDSVHASTSQRSISLGCTLSLSSFLLPELISTLKQTNTRISSMIVNTDKVLNALQEGKIDFGLVEGNFDKEEFSAIKIRDEEFIGVVNSKNPLAAQTKLDIADLINTPLIVREKGSGTRDIFANWIATQNYHIDDFHQVIEIGNPSPIIELLQRDVGVSFMYRSLVDDSLNNGHLSILQVTGFPIQHPINLVYLKDSYFANQYRQIATSLQLNRH